MKQPDRHPLPLPGRRPRRTALALGVAAALAACASSGSGVEDPFRGGREGGSRVRLEVQNNNFNDAAVFTVRSGERTRLGRVTGKTVDTFTFTWPISHPLEFSVQLVGGTSCRLQAPAIDPGDQVWIRIPSDMSLGRCQGGKR